MYKFDSDFAIFGVFTAGVQPNIPLGNSIIDYTNSTCTKLYGELKGQTIRAILAKACDSSEEAQRLLKTLEQEKEFTVEGKLNGKFIKYHTHLVQYCDAQTGQAKDFVQVGITDISESIILKELLYGTSEALKRAAMGIL